MSPTSLYERDNSWFAVEWDWRDTYLHEALGRLHRFRGVMPRVVVRGPYVYEVTGRGDAQAFLATHVPQVAPDLTAAVAQLNERLSMTAALERDRWEQSPVGAAGYERYLAALGPEVTLGEWLGDSRGAA